MLATRKSDNGPSRPHSQGLDLRHLTSESLELRAGTHVLASMAFGFTESSMPEFTIPLHPVVAPCKASIWTCSQAPRISQSSETFSLVETDRLLLGSIRLPAERIEHATKLAYRTIQKTILQRPGFRLIRLWNYLPGINLADEGVERYRLFSRARHDVLASSGYRMSSDLPAASAVGSANGPLVIHFLAGPGELTTVENPRQVSAYRYPRTYGPRSPSFSRAVIYNSELGRQLFLSGTASIIGHETIAPLEPEKQTHVTLDNLSALLDSAGYPKLNSLGSSASWVVYIRDPSHIDRIQPLITDHLHPDARIIYLQGDICRKDLMVEIEGTVFC